MIPLICDCCGHLMGRTNKELSPLDISYEILCISCADCREEVGEYVYDYK